MENFTQNLIESTRQAKEKIGALRKEDSFVFPIFTDVHSLDSDGERVNRLCEALKQITQEICCDAVVDLGDNMGMLGRNLHISNDDLKIVMENMFDRIYESVNCPLLVVNGNHDAVGTDFFKPDFWNEITKNKYGNINAVYDTSGSYYYVDFNKIKTRFVVLSLPSESDLEVEHPTPCWEFGSKQINWLKNEALNVSGNVIILTHVPFYYNDKTDKTKLLEVWNGKNTATSYITDLCGRIEDIEKVIEVINEFSKKTDTCLAGCFSGHTHEDSLWAPLQKKTVAGHEYFNTLPCYQVVTTGAFIPESTHSEFGISIDIAVWTPSEKELNIIRVGDGEDRKIYV